MGKRNTKTKDSPLMFMAGRPFESVGLDWLIKLGFNVIFSNKLEIHHSHEVTQHVFRFTWSNTTEFFGTQESQQTFLCSHLQSSLYAQNNAVRRFTPFIVSIPSSHPHFYFLTQHGYFLKPYLVTPLLGVTYWTKRPKSRSLIYQWILSSVIRGIRFALKMRTYLLKTRLPL